jgi:anhydro-N-acetylmuramic acid kinase
MRDTGPLTVLGTMSGTSLDGVDAAVLVTDGHAILGFGPAAYRAYTDAERATIRAALGRWPGEAGVAAAAEVVETAHAALLADMVAGVDVVGFHGQTLAHDPGGARTHQAGDGAVLAAVLGRTVVWDFRSADMELGGQGAPLAPFFHHACARWAGVGGPVLFLNLGGVGNLTFVDPRLPAPDLPGACLAFDTGPANAPIDDLMLIRRGLSRDQDGALAATGEPDETVIAAFLAHPWFLRMPPKSLDRDAFAALTAAVAGLADADAVATLTAAAATAVAQGLDHLPGLPGRVLVTGGGRRNATLMRMIGALMPCPVEPVEVLGLDGDMLEAQAFAYLAARVLCGLPTSAPGTTGVGAPVGGGKVSRGGDGRSGGA